MPLQKLKQIDVKGKKFDVNVSDEGQFYGQYEGEQIRAESLKQLTDKLAGRIARSKRVNIPFCMWEAPSWRSDVQGKLRTGVILGIHGSNSNLLVKFDDEKNSQQLSSVDFFDPKDGDELKRLSKALASAEQALETFKKKHEMDARGKVWEALGDTSDDEDAA